MVMTLDWSKVGIPSPTGKQFQKPRILGSPKKGDNLTLMFKKSYHRWCMITESKVVKDLWHLGSRWMRDQGYVPDTRERLVDCYFVIIPTADAKRMEEQTRDFLVRFGSQV